MRASIDAAVAGRRWVRPSGLAIVLLCMGVAFFLMLGFWQVRRAGEKQALLDAYASADGLATLSLKAARDRPQVGVLPHVEIRGRFDRHHAWILDDQVRNGQQGAMVFSLFEPVDGELPLLVNRGFLARDDNTGQLPDLPALAEVEQSVEGLYANAPGTGLRMGGNALQRQTTWPKLTIYLDPVEIGDDLGRVIDSKVLLQDADPDSGFVREWTPQILPPERHRGYAFQWFCFAIAAFVIFIVLHWRRPRIESQ